MPPIEKFGSWLAALFLKPPFGTPKSDLNSLPNPPQITQSQIPKPDLNSRSPETLGLDLIWRGPGLQEKIKPELKVRAMGPLAAFCGLPSSSLPKNSENFKMSSTIQDFDLGFASVTFKTLLNPSKPL